MAGSFWQPLMDAGDWLNDTIDEIGTGISNFWYGLTGQTEKTSAYQALMEREDSAYQRAAEDMKKAGLSKFGGVNPASSSSPAQSDPLAKALEIQQLRGVSLANKQASHDLKVSKGLGIRSSDKNALAPFVALYNMLFGPGKPFYGLDEKAVVWLKDRLSGLFGDGGTSSASVPPTDASSVPASVYDGFVPFTIDRMPTGYELGAYQDKLSAMSIPLETLKSLRGKEAEQWVSDFLVEEAEQGRGKAGGYENLPESLTSQVSKSYSADLAHFSSELRGSSYSDNSTVIGRLASILAGKHKMDYNKVYDDLWNKIHAPVRVKYVPYQ